MKAPPSKHKARKNKPTNGHRNHHHKTNRPNVFFHKTKILFQADPQGCNQLKRNKKMKTNNYETSIRDSSYNISLQDYPGNAYHQKQTYNPANKSISSISQLPCQNALSSSLKSQQISSKNIRKQQYLISHNSKSCSLKTAVNHSSHQLNITNKKKPKKILPMLPDRSSLLFDTKEKNKCQTLIDQLLDSKYAQIGHSQQLTMGFAKISQENDKEMKKSSQFSSDVNTASAGSLKNDNVNTQLYSAFLHRICKNDITNSNNTHPSSSKEFEFISPVAIPNISDLELIISSNRVSFSLQFIENLAITKKHLQCIYEFNLNFLKDMTQEGTQLTYLPFDEFMGSPHTHKLFVTVDATIMQMFNHSKTKQLHNLPDNLFLKSILQEQRSADSQNHQAYGGLVEPSQLQEEGMLSSRVLISQLFEQQQQKKQEMMKQYKEEKRQKLLAQREQQAKIFQVSQTSSSIKEQQLQQQVEQDRKDLLISHSNNTEQQQEESELQQKQQQQQQCSSSDAVSVADGVATLQDGQFWYDLSSPDGYRESSLLLTHPPKNGNLTLQEASSFAQDRFIRHHFLPQDHFQFIDILDPCQTTVFEFLELLGEILEMDVLEVARKTHLKILPTDAESTAILQGTTLFTCIYETPQRFLKEHCQIFHTIRKHFVLSQTTTTSNNDKQHHENGGSSNAGFKGAFGIFNRRNPLVLVKKTVHLKNFEFINALSNTPPNNTAQPSPPVIMSSLKQTNFKDASKLSLVLLPIEHFSINPLTIAQIDSMLQSFGIFQQIKDHLIAQDYSRFLDADNHVNVSLLLEALSMPSYNQNKNLEVLEVLGDVVIKYVSSLFLYRRLPDKRENVLTHTRSLFINNKFLGIVAFQNGLHFYARTKKPTSFEWRLNYIKEGSEAGGNGGCGGVDGSSYRMQPRQDCKQGKLTYSNLSDMLEAVIGSFYESQEFKLDACLKVCSSLELMIDRRLKIEVPQLVEGSFLMPRRVLEEAMNVKEGMTYRDLQQIARSAWEKGEDKEDEEDDDDDGKGNGDCKKNTNGIGSRDEDDNNNNNRDEVQHRLTQGDFVWIEIAELLSKEKEFQRLFEDKQELQNQKNVTNIYGSSANVLANPLSSSPLDPAAMMMIHNQPKNSIVDPNERRRYRREYKKYQALHSDKLTAALKAFEDNCLGYTFKDKRLLLTALNCGCDDLSFSSRRDEGQVDLHDQNMEQTQNDYAKSNLDEEEQKRRSLGESNHSSSDLDVRNDYYLDGMMQQQNRKRNSKMKENKIIGSYSNNYSDDDQEEQKEQIWQNPNKTRLNYPMNTKKQQEVAQSIVDATDEQADKRIQGSYQQSTYYQSNCSQFKLESTKDSSTLHHNSFSYPIISDSSSYGSDYQKLEFLGDSLIEILVVSNAFYLSRLGYGDGLKCPYAFCELKSLLLSNDFLSRAAVLNGFHRYALNISASAVDEIIKFISLVDFDVEFSSSISHQNTSPKVLGDLWESIAAAVLMDSDVNTFVAVYGKLYAPFISHFVKYYNSLVFNPKEKVQLVAQQLKLQFHVNTENNPKSDRGNNKLHYFENKHWRYEYPQQQNSRLDGADNMIKKTVFLNNVAIGTGEGDSELLAERKAFHEAYQRLFVRCDTNLGFVFHGKNI